MRVLLFCLLDRSAGFCKLFDTSKTLLNIFFRSGKGQADASGGGNTKAGDRGRRRCRLHGGGMMKAAIAPLARDAF